MKGVGSTALSSTHCVSLYFNEARRATRGDSEPSGLRLFSEPTPEELLRWGGAQGGSGSSPPIWIPNRGVQGEPMQKILRSTCTRAGHDTYVSDAVSSPCPTCSSPCGAAMRALLLCRLLRRLLTRATCRSRRRIPICPAKLTFKANNGVAKELTGLDQWRRKKEHSQQQAKKKRKRAQPTAGQKKSA